MHTIVHRLRTILVLAVTGSGLLMATGSAQAAGFYLADDAVDVTDGVIEEAWGDAIIDDGEDNPDREGQCWNVDSSEWESVTNLADCSTVLFDEEGQIDMLNGWFGVNETNMLLAFETATPMFSMRDMVEDEYFEIFNQEKLSEWGIAELPEDFSHDMVFAFDVDPVDGEESYDWYMVANIDYSLGEMSENEDFLQIWQEEGTTAGFQDDEDTLITSIDTTQSESTEFTEVLPIMEIRQNIELFYETTGITVGDEVGFRLETHSVTGDTTDPVTVQFVDSAPEVSADAIVVGSGATSFKGRNPKKYPRGVVTVYNDSADDQSEVLAFTAYNKKVGVQVAVGDVDGDGEQEIVTMPFKKIAKPEWKVFNLAGELETSGVIPTKKGKGLEKSKKSKSVLHVDMNVSGEEDTTLPKKSKIQRFNQYYLAVGDVDGNDQDEIVLSGAKGNRLFIDILKLTDEGKAQRVNQFMDNARFGYAQGSWVEVEDIDGETGDEIITTPMRGKPVIDIWQVSTDGTSLDHIVQYEDLVHPGFTAGLHIAANNGMVVAVEHGSKGKVHMLEWIEAKGNLEPTNTTFNVGSIGNVAYNGTQVLYSSFTKKFIRKLNTSGDTIYTITTNHKGGFVDYLDL